VEITTTTTEQNPTKQYCHYFALVFSFSRAIVSLSRIFSGFFRVFVISLKFYLILIISLGGIKQTIYSPSSYKLCYLSPLE